MRKRIRFITLAAGLALLGCEEDPTSPEENGLDVLRQATDRYRDVATAVEDGFEPAPPVCVTNPDGPGALGIAYAKFDLIDTTIDLQQPEVLFYEPQENGELELVGVESVVPIEDWEAQYDDPPAALGQTFHRNDAEGLFGIHFWIWRDNPDGVFEFWHPGVSCEYADE